MAEQELGKCYGCGKEAVLSRKYFYYSVECGCCGGEKHFEAVKHCEDCKPRPPTTIRVYLEINPDCSES